MTQNLFIQPTQDEINTLNFHNEITEVPIDVCDLSIQLSFYESSFSVQGPLFSSLLMNGSNVLECDLTLG